MNQAFIIIAANRFYDVSVSTVNKTAIHRPTGQTVA